MCSTGLASSTGLAGTAGLAGSAERPAFGSCGCPDARVCRVIEAELDRLGVSIADGFVDVWTPVL